MRILSILLTAYLKADLAAGVLQDPDSVIMCRLPAYESVRFDCLPSRAQYRRSWLSTLRIASPTWSFPVRSEVNCAV